MSDASPEAMLAHTRAVMDQDVAAAQEWMQRASDDEVRNVMGLAHAMRTDAKALGEEATRMLGLMALIGLQHVVCLDTEAVLREQAEGGES